MYRSFAYDWLAYVVRPDLEHKPYSHLFNKRGGWNKRGGGAKVAKSLNMEVGINVEDGIFWKKLVCKYLKKSINMDGGNVCGG